jgi:hypothetical protein
MENFYYECFCDILRKADTHRANILALNHIKAKIVKLHSTSLHTSLLHTTEADRLAGEQPTLFQLTEMQKRLTVRTVRIIRDDSGFIQTSPEGIALAFTTFLRSKYDNIEVDTDYVGTVAEIESNVIRTTNTFLRAHLAPAKYTRPFTPVGETWPRQR